MSHYATEAHPIASATGATVDACQQCSGGPHACDEMAAEIDRLRAVNAELLEACKAALRPLDQYERTSLDDSLAQLRDILRATLAKAEVKP
jgi:hypothetical protein